MTREQAKREIVSLDFYLLNHTDDYGEESHTAMMMAINALEELPKRRKEAKRWKMKAMQNNSCDDAISRREAISIASIATMSVNDVVSMIKDLPPVTPQPKTGYWIEHPEIETSAPEYLMFCECSECGDKQCFCKPDIHRKHFCNNCGAKMEEQA